MSKAPVGGPSAGDLDGSLTASDSDDAGLTCPLCTEEMDQTDLNFLPCSCGFQVRRRQPSRLLQSPGKCSP